MFRMIGNHVQILRYKLTCIEKEYNRETGELEQTARTIYAANETEKNELLALHAGATTEALDTTEIEWLDGLTFDSFEEAEKAQQSGIYLPKRSVLQLQADIDYIAIMTGVEL